MTKATSKLSKVRPPRQELCRHFKIRLAVSNGDGDNFSGEKYKLQPGSSGAQLWTQHSGSRGWQISEFKASLVYRENSRTARTIQRNPFLKNSNQN